MFCNVRINFGKRSDDLLWGECKDESSIDCGDYSDERFEAIRAEVLRKLTCAWKYMANRSANATRSDH